MARHFTTTIEYNPYTFEEMWQPAEYATEAHMKQANALNELESKTGMLGEYIDPSKDPEEFQTWNNYMNNLRQASDDLGSNGLSTRSLKNLYSMSSMYGSKIKPIEVGVENQQKYSELLREVVKDNDNLLIKDVSDYKLKDFMHGVPNPEYISAKAVRDQATAMAQADAKNIVNVLPPQQYDRYNQVVYQKTGLSMEQALTSLQDPQSKLNFIKELIMEVNGADRLLENGKENNYARLDQAVNMGLIAGSLGETKMDMMDNGRKHQESMALQWANHQLNREKYEFDKAAKAAELAAKAQAQPENIIKKALVTRHGFNGKSDSISRVFAAAGPDAKKWQQGLGSLVMASGKGEISKGKYKVKCRNEKGETKTLTINPDDAKSFNVGFEGRRMNGGSPLNAKASTEFLVEINGEKYYMTPEELGLPYEQSALINTYFGSSGIAKDQFSEEQYQQVMLTRDIISKWRKNPDYLTKEESQAVQSLLDEMTCTLPTTIYNMGKFNSTDYKQD